VDFGKIKERQNTKSPPFCCGGDDNPSSGEQRDKIRIFLMRLCIDNIKYQLNQPVCDFITIFVPKSGV